MKLTITTASQTLEEIIDADVRAASIRSLMEEGYLKMTITNTTANIVYKELGATAAAGTGFPIATNEFNTFIIVDIRQVHLIASVESVVLIDLNPVNQC